MKIKLLNKETDSIEEWSVQEMLDHINDDRNPEWIPYTKDDWREGWKHWGNDETYSLIS